MTPRDLERVAVAILQDLLADAECEPQATAGGLGGRGQGPATRQTQLRPGAELTVVVRPADAGARSWRIVTSVRLPERLADRFVGRLRARREFVSAKWMSGPGGPVDVELGDLAFAAALRSLHASAGSAGTVSADGCSSRFRAVLTTPGGGDVGARQSGDDPWRTARYAHARAVRRGVLARRCEVEPVVLAELATREQLELLTGVLDTHGALERAGAVDGSRRERTLGAHLGSLADRAHASFDATVSRPLGARPVTDGHRFSAAVDALAAAALADTLHALDEAAPRRL